MATINEGIVIGGAGGAIAGITVWLVQYLHGKTNDFVDGKRIYKWLQKHTSDEPGKQFRSTRAIASWNNITEDRAKYLCSINDKIFMSTGANEDMWGIHTREDRPKVLI
ncbi:MAG TPA: hypothetical protein DCX54_13805 [Flavobacteriales bacterium]|nr:hypothetical protein [Flavobacteriales bacterium]